MVDKSKRRQKSKNSCRWQAEFTLLDVGWVAFTNWSSVLECWKQNTSTKYASHLPSWGSKPKNTTLKSKDNSPSRLPAGRVLAHRWTWAPLIFNATLFSYPIVVRACVFAGWEWARRKSPARLSLSIPLTSISILALNEHFIDSDSPLSSQFVPFIVTLKKVVPFDSPLQQLCVISQHGYYMSVSEVSPAVWKFRSRIQFIH